MADYHEIVGPDGKVVGVVTNGFYISDRDILRHFFDKYKSFGISISPLEDIKKFGGKYVVLVVYEGNKFLGTWATSFENYANSEKTWLDKKNDLQKHFEYSKMIQLDDATAAQARIFSESRGNWNREIFKEGFNKIVNQIK